jgi:hypothetical protein
VDFTHTHRAQVSVFTSRAHVPICLHNKRYLVWFPIFGWVSGAMGVALSVQYLLDLRYLERQDLC